MADCHFVTVRLSHEFCRWWITEEDIKPRLRYYLIASIQFAVRVYRSSGSTEFCSIWLLTRQFLTPPKVRILPTSKETEVHDGCPLCRVWRCAKVGLKIKVWIVAISLAQRFRCVGLRCRHDLLPAVRLFVWEVTVSRVMAWASSTGADKHSPDVMDACGNSHTNLRSYARRTGCSYRKPVWLAWRLHSSVFCHLALLMWYIMLQKPIKLPYFLNIRLIEMVAK